MEGQESPPPIATGTSEGLSTFSSRCCKRQRCQRSVPVGLGETQQHQHRLCWDTLPLTETPALRPCPQGASRAGEGVRTEDHLLRGRFFWGFANLERQ